MRPLAVLLLVLGSLAALLFALTTLTDSSGRAGEEVRGVATAPGESRPRAELVAPAATETPVAARPDVQEETRHALVPEVNRGRRKVEFGSIEGIVVDRQSRPVAEATVSLLNEAPSPLGDDARILRGEEPPRPLAKVVTDAKGTFRFDQLDPEEPWTLVVTHARFLTATTGKIDVPEGAAWQEMVVVELGQTLSGFVRDASTHQPIPGALLVVEGGLAVQMRKRSQGRMEATTDANGAYSFSNVGNTAQGRVMTVSAPGYATQVHNNFLMVTMGDAPSRFKNVQPPPQIESRTQDFELEAGKVIAGRVVDPEHRGTPGIEIEAFSQSGTMGSQGYTKSGANGEFLIEGLAEGIYTLRIVAGRYDANPLQRVEAGDTNVQIELFELSEVTGRVIDEGGQPLASFVVKARTANDVNKAFGSVVAQRQVKGAKDGRFQLRGVPEGSYVIEAMADGYPSCFSDTFTATQGLVTSDIVVRMTRGGSLRGIVLNRYDNAPVEGAEVSTVDNDFVDANLWQLFGALEPTATTKVKVFTDSEGRFSIEAMTPGPYQVQVRMKGFSTLAVKDVQVVEGQVTELPPLLLIQGAIIRGVVYGPGKIPQPGASVQLAPADFALGGSREVRTDSSGRYVIANAEPGTYQLSATRPSYGTGNPFEAIADMKQSQIEVSIEDGRTYEHDLQLGN